MFHVLTKPFPASIEKLIKEGDPRIVLVYSGERAERVMISCAPSDEDTPEFLNWFSTVAEELNHPLCLLHLKLMLWGIKDTRLVWDDYRAYEERRHFRRLRADFGADFGRLDFSSPGRGGHGFDDGDGGY